MDWKSLLRASFRRWAASLSLNVLAIVSNWVKETAGLKKFLASGSDLSFFIRGHHVSQRVSLFDLALGIGEGHGEETGAVEVDIGVQEFLAEGVDLTGVVLRDMAVTEVFADDGAVFGFRQTIVVAVPGA